MTRPKQGYGQYSLYSRLVDILYMDKEELDNLHAKPVLSSNDVVIQEAAREIRQRLVQVCYKCAQQKLTAKQHKVFDLRHKQDMTYHEIMEEINQPYGTVYNVVNGMWNLNLGLAGPRWGGYMRKLIRKLRVRPDVKMLLHQWKECIIRQDPRASLEYLRKKDEWWNEWQLLEEGFRGKIYEER